jgi:predicted ATP-grasp superfamily ATP-dependent carboligase
MNLLQQEIDSLESSIGWRTKAIAIAAKYNEVLKDAVSGSVYSASLEARFDDHALLMNAIKLIGGKFARVTNNRGVIIYSQDIDGVSVSLSLSKGAHPTCKVEEVEEIIPEHVVPEEKVTRYKVICGDLEEDSNGN